MINVSLASETSLERISLLRPRIILKTVGNCENSAFSIYFYAVRVFTFEMVERDILEMRITRFLVLHGQQRKRVGNGLHTFLLVSIP